MVSTAFPFVSHPTPSTRPGSSWSPTTRRHTASRGRSTALAAFTSLLPPPTTRYRCANVFIPLSASYRVCETLDHFPDPLFPFEDPVNPPHYPDPTLSEPVPPSTPPPPHRVPPLSYPYPPFPSPPTINHPPCPNDSRGGNSGCPPRSLPPDSSQPYILF